MAKPMPCRPTTFLFRPDADQFHPGGLAMLGQAEYMAVNWLR